MIEHDGWTIYVSVHDAWHLRTLGAFKRRLVNGTPSVRGERTRRYKEWLWWEERYYEALGLPLPSRDVAIPKPVKAEGLHGRWYRRPSSNQRST